MRYRIVVDKDLCQGHGMCCAEAPGVFQVTDQGQLYDNVNLLTETVEGTAYSCARDAASACPNRVITLIPVDELASED